MRRLIMAPDRLGFRRLIQVSPLSVVGMAVCGLIISMLFGMGPVYGRNLGLNNTEIGYFMTSIMVGTLLLQLGRCLTSLIGVW